jgi:hypothetical protein
MYREDLDQLVSLFERCEKVVISDNKYRYDSLQEMEQHLGPKITELDLRGENPGVRLLFNQKEVVKGSSPPMETTFNELRTEEIAEVANALFYEIKDFLIGYQRPYLKVGFLIVAAIAVIGAFVSVFLLMELSREGRSSNAIAVVLGICLVTFLLSLLLGSARGNALSLETRAVSSSFFVRNREEFGKQAVSHTIGVVIGGLVGYFLGHFLK